jgi:CYTH domain-containing protein
MDKTAHTELYRTFLIEKLPDPLTPASAHLQLFDNYLEKTRIRLRHVRDPATREWTRILQQRIGSDYGVSKLTEMHLSAEEYSLFERFEGREIRKNRYFHEFDRLTFAFDIHLGGLWGLVTARVDFQSLDQMSQFEPPSFALFEITGVPAFDGWSLVGQSFADIQQAVLSLPQVERADALA